MSSIEEFILGVKNTPTFASITNITEVYMKKTSKGNRKFANPLLACGMLAQIESTYQILVNVNYQNMVNVVLKKDGKESLFESQSLWHGTGQYYHNCPFGRLARNVKNEQKYFVYSPFKCTAFRYLVNGREASETERIIIKNYSPEKTENLVEWRLVKLENIKRLAIDNKVFEI